MYEGMRDDGVGIHNMKITINEMLTHRIKSPFVTALVKLEGIMLTEMNQTGKVTTRHIHPDKRHARQAGQAFSQLSDSPFQEMILEILLLPLPSLSFSSPFLCPLLPLTLLPPPPSLYNSGWPEVCTDPPAYLPCAGIKSLFCYVSLF